MLMGFAEMPPPLVLLLAAKSLLYIRREEEVPGLATREKRTWKSDASKFNIEWALFE